MRYLTAAEAARRIGVNEKTVRLWLQHGTYGLTAHHPNGAKNRLAIAEDDVMRVQRERAQYQPDTTGLSGSAETGKEEGTDITGLEARVSELERKYTELERKLEGTHGYNTGTVATSERYRPARSTTLVRSPERASLPEGAILLADLSKKYGIAVNTLKNQIENGRRLEDGSVDKLEASSQPRPGRPEQTTYYFTREQQAAALAFWQRHNVVYNDDQGGQ